jgi:DNA-binding LytR/AlgR family response regulator
MTQAIIIEDEPLVAKHLQKQIEATDPTIQIITVLDSIRSCLVYFKSNVAPDLLFMDIQLSDGVSFDLLNEIQIDCPIIFTTAYDEYAIRAFKLNSIDYLLKPIDKEELKSAIEKFKRFQSSSQYYFKEQFQSLMKHLELPQNNKVYKERFLVRSGKSYVIIDFKDIALFEKDVLIYLVTREKQRFITDYQTMEEIEELLDPACFFRANRQMIIQSSAVESFKGNSYGKLVVKLRSPVNNSVDISREKAQAFKNWVQ